MENYENFRENCGKYLTKFAEVYKKFSCLLPRPNSLLNVEVLISPCKRIKTNHEYKTI